MRGPFATAHILLSIPHNRAMQRLLITVGSHEIPAVEVSSETEMWHCGQRSGSTITGDISGSHVVVSFTVATHLCLYSN